LFSNLVGIISKLNIIFYGTGIYTFTLLYFVLLSYNNDVSISLSGAVVNSTDLLYTFIILSITKWSGVYIQREPVAHILYSEKKNIGRLIAWQKWVSMVIYIKTGKVIGVIWLKLWI